MQWACGRPRAGRRTAPCRGSTARPPPRAVQPRLFSSIKFSGANHDANLVLVDDPSRLRSQITSVLYPKTLVSCTSFVYRVYLTRAIFARRILRSRYLNFPLGASNRALCSSHAPSGTSVVPNTSALAEERANRAGVHNMTSLHVAAAIARAIADDTIEEYNIIHACSNS